jgi:alkaline phosphatase
MLQIEGGYEPTVFDEADNVALITTYSANNRVTDSAAAGTALATGFKTNNSMVGVTPDSVAVHSIIKKAHDKGFATGIAVTCYLQHATPAAFYAHLMNRDDKKKANEDFVASGVDVAFGGGRVYFERFDKDYVQTLTNAGYNVLLDEAQLASAEGDKVVGLFADRSMNKILEGRGDYLANATAKALELLDKNVEKNSREGFVLMVEGSKIDFRTHDHETVAILAEMRDFEKAIKVAKEYVAEIINRLKEYEYNPEIMRLVVMGGGAGIVKRYIDIPEARIEYIDDIRATAVGYEVAAYTNMQKELM